MTRRVAVVAVGGEAPEELARSWAAGRRNAQQRRAERARFGRGAARSHASNAATASVSRTGGQVGARADRVLDDRGEALGLAPRHAPSASASARSWRSASSVTAGRGRLGIARRHRLGRPLVHRGLVGRDQAGEQRGVLEVDRADRVEDQAEDDVPRRLDEAGEEREVGGLLARGDARQRAQLLGLLVGAPLGGERGGGGEQEPPRLHERLERVAADARASNSTCARTSSPLAVRQSATRIASPCRTSTSRSCSRRLIASRTVVAFSPYSVASARCGGSFSPGAYRPARIVVPQEDEQLLRRGSPPRVPLIGTLQATAARAAVALRRGPGGGGGGSAAGEAPAGGSAGRPTGTGGPRRPLLYGSPWRSQTARTFGAISRVPRCSAGRGRGGARSGTRGCR